MSSTMTTSGHRRQCMGWTWSYFPVGAGIGTFESVYPLHERVTDLIWQGVNRAHNDALETVFKGGILSLVLLLSFVGWLVNSTYCALSAEMRFKDGMPVQAQSHCGSCLCIRFGIIPCAQLRWRRFLASVWLCNLIRHILE